MQHPGLHLMNRDSFRLLDADGSPANNLIHRDGDCVLTSTPAPVVDPALVSPHSFAIFYPPAGCDTF